jgi:hypothetical protein
MRFTLSLGLAGVLVAAGGCQAEPAAPPLAPIHGTLFINEFMAANDSTLADEAGDYDDWVELFNAGDSDIDLGACYLTDDLELPMKWTFPDTVIPASGYLIVWCDGEYDEGWLHASFKLNADPGEQLGLFWTDGERLMVVDTLSYGAQATDTSRGRFPDGGGWMAMGMPTPGARNTSGRSGLFGLLFVNELMAANDSTLADEVGDYDDWVELHNAGESAVRLGGLTLTDDLAQPAKWAFPDTAIAPGGYLIVWCDGEESEGPLHANFNLGAIQGEQVGIFDYQEPHQLRVDGIIFGPQRVDTSWGRVPDAGAEWRFLAEPTPGRPNPEQ